MSVKHTINAALSRATGFEVVRSRRTATSGPVVQGDRLLRAPVFVLSSIRSGSTLLRVMLGSHSTLYAPHEMHLCDIRADLTSWFSEQAVAELGFDRDELTSMLWDRMLHAALERSGKRTLVEKTPNDLFIYRRIQRTWPDARFLFLLRHPGTIYQSWREARPKMTTDEAVADTLKYLVVLQEARSRLPGVDVRYEDLTDEPERETRRICEYLEIEWEPGMIEYGDQGHTRFKRGLGDWSGKINSGRPQQGRPLPDLADIPSDLHKMCRSLGYTQGNRHAVR